MRKQTVCPSTELLSQFDNGLLAESDIEWIQGHLETCGDCLSRLDALRAAETIIQLGRNSETQWDAERSASLIRRVRFLGNADTHNLDETVDRLEVQASSPKSFGRYEVVRELGQGGMGTVFVAEDRAFGRRVAVKSPKLAGTPVRIGTLRERFLREARAAAAVRHAHLCPVYDCGVENDQPYLVMAFIPGMTLADLIKQGRFPNLRDALLMMQRIADGIAVIHRAGMVHRDLKPANILLESNNDEPDPHRWSPLVTDFGLARANDDSGNTEDQTAAGIILGTPNYMSPEQALGDRAAIGPPTDVWSLGVILHEMLTAEKPFAAPTSLEVLDKVCRADPPALESLRPEVPSSVRAILQKCLDKTPASRYPNAGALADGLAQVLKGEDIEEAKPDSTQPWMPAATRKKNKRVRWLIPLAASVVLAVAGTLMAIRPWERDNPAAAPAGPPDSGGSASHTAEPLPMSKKPVAMKGNLDLLILESTGLPDKFVAGNPRRQHVRLDDPLALPLTPRDWVRIEATVDQPAYFYLIWVDTEGVAVPIFPWNDLDWNQRPASESPRKELFWPGRDLIAPLSEGPPGVEAILFFARSQPLTPEEYAMLPKLFPKQSRKSEVARTSRFAVWLENGERKIELTRGPIRPDITAKIDDPEIQIAQIMNDLKTIFPYSRGVLFGNTGKK